MLLCPTRRAPAGLNIRRQGMNATLRQVMKSFSEQNYNTYMDMQNCPPVIVTVNREIETMSDHDCPDAIRGDTLVTYYKTRRLSLVGSGSSSPTSPYSPDTKIELGHAY